MTLGEFEDMMDSCVRCSKCKFIPQLVIQSHRFSSICPSIDYYNFHAYMHMRKLVKKIQNLVLSQISLLVKVK